MGTETETVNIDKPATNEHRHADGPKAAREEDIVPDSWNLYENMLCPIESVSIGDDRHIHPRSHGDMRRAVCVAFIILITAACLVGIPYDTSSCLDYQGSHTAIQDLQHRGITLSNVCSIFHFKSDIPMAGWLTIGLPLFVTTITIPDFEHPNHAITTKRYERMTASNVWSIDRRFTIAITILCAIPYAAADPISGGSPSQPTGTSASTSRLLIISAALVVLGNVLGNVSMALTGAFGVLLMPVSAISCVLLIITTTNTDDMPLWMRYPVGVVWALLSTTTLRVERRNFEPEQRTLFTVWILFCTMGLVSLASATRNADLQTAFPASFSAATYIVARLLPRHRLPILPQ